MSLIRNMPEIHDSIAISELKEAKLWTLNQRIVVEEAKLWFFFLYSIERDKKNMSKKNQNDSFRELTFFRKNSTFRRFNSIHIFSIKKFQ